MPRAPILAAVLLLVPAAASAEEPPRAACAATDAAVPAPFTAWTSKAAVTSAARASDLGRATIAPGEAVTAALHPTPEVAYVAQPAKPGGAVSHGGLLGLAVREPGTYAVALGAGAWVDVLKDGAAVEATAHGRGPGCASIRKVVDFPLQPGRYVLQISANAAADLAVLVVRRP